MRKKTSLAVICLLFAISTVAQTSKQHFNLGMTIDDFATKFELARMDTREADFADAAARSAMRGERSIIQTTIGGKKMAFLFDNFTLREVEITAGNSFEHELQALTELSQFAGLEGRKCFGMSEGYRKVFTTRRAELRQSRELFRRL